MQNAEQLQHEQLYFVVSGLRSIAHGNPDNNLESHCIFIYFNGLSDHIVSN
jgi:hypothetical protein